MISKIILMVSALVAILGAFIAFNLSDRAYDLISCYPIKRNEAEKFAAGSCVAAFVWLIAVCVAGFGLAMGLLQVSAFWWIPAVAVLVATSYLILGWVNRAGQVYD